MCHLFLTECHDPAERCFSQKTKLRAGPLLVLSGCGARKTSEIQTFTGTHGVPYHCIPAPQVLHPLCSMKVRACTVLCQEDTHSCIPMSQKRNPHLCTLLEVRGHERKEGGAQLMKGRK